MLAVAWAIFTLLGLVFLSIPKMRRFGLPVILAPTSALICSIAGMILGGYVGLPLGPRVQYVTVISGFIVGQLLGLAIGILTALVLNRRLKWQ